jgi:hypothetical protein
MRGCIGRHCYTYNYNKLLQLKISFDRRALYSFCFSFHDSRLLSCDWLSHTSFNSSESESDSCVTTEALIWGLRPDFYYCQTVAGLLLWVALSDERSGLSFTIAVGFASVVDSRPYFTVSDSRLPFSSPPTTRRATVEVFYLASTRDSTRLPNCSMFYYFERTQ